ncbi:Sec-independent protein translocase subunit TatA [Sanguibacter antarcticus]|uniref:Sec-independent protein translocase protein TatA n=1 Tax=Sanguibacter antarcticus TaxID=372484 RepID=A0A2A9E2S8_9MICO|nr:Sec-independent protein translocase subunit TatA [Sanguibacter antarcticus]PFG33154.1 sec-independent protein translocase protein TatA [Sanguibacter antarcticus]
MGALKPIHWLVFIVILLLLFGAKRLPDLAKSVGQSLKIFKKEIKELNEDDAPAPVQPQTYQQPQANPVPGAPAAGGPAIPLDTTNPATRTGPASSPESTTPPKV